MTLTKLVVLSFVLLFGLTFWLVNTARMGAMDAERVANARHLRALGELKGVCTAAWPKKGEHYWDCINTGLDNQ